MNAAAVQQMSKGTKLMILSGWVVAAVCLIIVTVVLGKRSDAPATAPPPAVVSQPRTPEPHPDKPADTPRDPADIPGEEALPKPDTSKDAEAVQGEIADLQSQYDPKAVRPLAVYLYHPDPEIRDAARRGLMQLGEASAVPYLRAAAKAEKDPVEAKELTAAANFLDLPPVVPVPKKKKSQ